MHRPHILIIKEGLTFLNHLVELRLQLLALEQIIVLLLNLVDKGNELSGLYHI